MRFPALTARRLIAGLSLSAGALALMPAGAAIAAPEDEAAVAPTMSLAAAPASIPEPGGPVSFRLSISNPNADAITVTGLTSTLVGSLAGKGTCSAAVTVPPRATAACAYPATVAGDAGQTVSDTVTGSYSGGSVEATPATASNLSATARVAITDVLPHWTMSKDDRGQTVAETEGILTYFVTARNFGPEPLTITAVQDVIVSAGNRPIDITREGDVVYRTTCGNIVGAVMSANGGLYECEFDIPFRGNAGDVKINDLSITVTDNEKNTDTRLDSEDTEMTDVKPSIDVTKTDNDATLPWNGGNVTYHVTIKNTSVEAVVVKSIADEIGGASVNVTAVGGAVSATTCGSLIGTWIDRDATVSCSFTLAVSGTPGTSVRDVITVTVGDDDGNVVSASDDEHTPLGNAPATTAPTTTIAAAPETSAPTTAAPTTAGDTAVLASVATPVPATGSLALTGSDVGRRVAFALMALGAGMVLLSIEVSARAKDKATATIG